MSSKINLQTCEYARKSSIFQDNQLILYKKYIYMKRRNDQSTYKFNGAIATILLQFRHTFYLSCIKFLLKVCSNHGIIGLDYFILRHGHFAHGYYIW